MRRWPMHLAPICFVALCLGFIGQATAAERPWSADDLDALGTLPIQDGGRIKPVDTYAGFLLLRLNGSRVCEMPNGDSIDALEWFWTTLLFPEEAREYQVFLVQNAEVLDAAGLSHDKKRDRYSYNQLVGARAKLFELARQYSHLDAKERTPVESQIVNLAVNMSEFERLLGALHFARTRIEVEDSGVWGESADGTAARSVVELLASSKSLATLMATSRLTSASTASIQRVLAELQHVFDEGGGLPLIPPPGTIEEIEEWMDFGDVAAAAFAPMVDTEPQIQALALLEKLEASKSNPEAFSAAVAALGAHTRELAEARGEYRAIPLEVAYYKAQFVYYSLLGFILCFLLAVANWVAPRSRWLWAAGIAALSVPTLYLIAGIVVRCIIRSRPPVSTLYESILFITASIVVLGIVIEWINRDRIALSLAAVFGALGLFLANKYEAVEGVDTMPSLVAVLDTNFWLATHVTTVTIGYAAGLLAAGVAHLFLLGKLFGFKKTDDIFYRRVVKLTYGIICFGLVFSVVGTVLGGIWANYSWGRFWGWDPKENGALMIVLWELAIIHLRLGGRLRQFGLCLCAVFGGIIVAFSWFGVNLLGIGLHSYGFTSGVAKALVTFYAIESAVLLLGGIAWWRSGRTHAPASKDAKPLPGDSAPVVS